MLVRLLLALLAAALPLPAMAGPACHAPAPAASTHHGTKHQPAQPTVEMLCLGCVAPATLRAPAIAAPLRFPAMLSAPAVLTGLPLEPARPATPPPRFEA